MIALERSRTTGHKSNLGSQAAFMPIRWRLISNDMIFTSLLDLLTSMSDS